MSKLWKDTNPPSDTSLIWVRLNQNGNKIGYFKYDGGKWVITSCKEIKEDAIAESHQAIVDRIVGGAPEEYDTLLELLQRIEEIVAEQTDHSIYYNTTEYWNSYNQVPKAGDIIIYSDYAAKTIDDGEGNITEVAIPGIKIGSGNAYVQDLGFVGENVLNELLNHINDQIRHITSQERDKWNKKLNIDDTNEVQNEILIFNRN